MSCNRDQLIKTTGNLKITETQLIEGCCKGEREFQRELYNRYAAAMLMVSMRYCKNREDAEDILQESFIKVYKKIKTFRRQSSLGNWIKRIVINTAINFQRSKLYLFPMVELEETTDISSSHQGLENCSMNELLAMVQALPVGCQVIFNLYAIEGYNHREIASMLRISQGTSKSQYARAKGLLQKMIAESNNINYERYQ